MALTNPKQVNQDSILEAQVDKNSTGPKTDVSGSSVLAAQDTRSKAQRAKDDAEIKQYQLELEKQVNVIEKAAGISPADRTRYGETSPYSGKTGSTSSSTSNQSAVVYNEYNTYNNQTANQSSVLNTEITKLTREEISALESNSEKLTVNNSLLSNYIQQSAETNRIIETHRTESISANPPSPVVVMTREISGPVEGSSKPGELVNFYSKPFSTIDQTKKDGTTGSDNSVKVKSSNIIESSSARKAIEPDRGLEKSVDVLSTVLPATINNLSSTVSNISTPSASTVINNEGQTVNQNSNVNTTYQKNETQSQMSTDEKKKADTVQERQSDFYLQGIYQALMSGKIKVKLEYQ